MILPKISRPHYSHVPKGRWERNFDSQGLGLPNTIFVTTSHDHHRSRRAPTGKSFSKRRIASLEPLIPELVDKLLTRMGEFSDGGMPLSNGAAYSALTMDTIGVYALGFNNNTLNQENFNARYESLGENMGPLYHNHKQRPRLPALFDPIPVWLVRKLDPGAATWKTLQNVRYVPFL